MSTARIKTVLKYIIALAIPPVLCAYIMIPLFLVLLITTGLLDICPPKYVILASYVLCAIACGASGFIMSLLISSLSRNREIMMTLFGVLIVAIIYIITFVDLFSSTDFSNNIPEGSWKYLLIPMALSGILLLGFALTGAWLIVRKRRLRVPKDK